MTLAPHALAWFAASLVSPLVAPAPPNLEDADELERGLVERKAGAFEGYTLFSPLRSKNVYLIDMDGEVKHVWETDHPPGNSVHLFDDGRLLRCARVENPLFHGGGQGGRIQEFDWDGNLTWDFEFSNEERMHHHDFEVMPNGNVLLIAWEYVSPGDARRLGRDRDVISEEGFWPDFVVEVEPMRPDGGKIVWEWHAADHLIQDHDERAEGYGDVTRHPERIDVNGDHRDDPPMSAEMRENEEEREEQMRALGYLGGDDDDDKDDARKSADWMHTNSVAYHATHDLIALSVRTFDEIWVIDHSTTTEQARGSRGGRWGKGGDLLYRWGNPKTYGRGGPPDQALFGQHDATWIDGPDGAPHLLIFNNGAGRPGGETSSVIELALPFEPKRGFRLDAAKPYGPERTFWSHTQGEEERYHSSFISGAQRLPNGNTLVCAGLHGCVFEVTHDGRIVWEYLNPFGGEEPLMMPNPKKKGGGVPDMAHKGLFRATRLPADHPGLARLGE